MNPKIMKKKYLVTRYNGNSIYYRKLYDKLPILTSDDDVTELTDESDIKYWKKFIKIFQKNL